MLRGLRAAADQPRPVQRGPQGGPARGPEGSRRVPQPDHPRGRATRPTSPSSRPTCRTRSSPGPATRTPEHGADLRHPALLRPRRARASARRSSSRAARSAAPGARTRRVSSAPSASGTSRTSAAAAGPAWRSVRPRRSHSAPTGVEIDRAALRPVREVRRRLPAQRARLRRPRPGRWTRRWRSSPPTGSSIERSGGGVTFSGGDPLAPGRLRRGGGAPAQGAGHPHRRSRPRSSRRGRRSSGSCPVIDLFIVDVKVADPARHAALTGQDNGLILANLRRLAAALNGTGRLLAAGTAHPRLHRRRREPGRAGGAGRLDRSRRSRSSS